MRYRAFFTGVVALAVMAGAAHAQTDPGGIDRNQSQWLEQLAKAHPLPPAQLKELEEIKEFLKLLGSPPKTVIDYDGGGVIYEYEARWRELGIQGGSVEIRGLCESACTLITAYVPKDRICFGPLAALNFHMARASKTDNTPDLSASQQMLESYPADIQSWINWKGGLGLMPRVPREYWSLGAKQLWAMGYKRCSQ